MQSWFLENADEIQKSAPYTFYRPSAEVISHLEPEKAIVKLIFGFESDKPDLPVGERMWVIINSIKSDGTYEGTLDNDPYHIKDLKAGDKILFKANNIVDYDTLDDLKILDTEAGRLEQYFKRCIVSKQITKDHLRTEYIYREEPTEERDSGWHIMSGKETDEYLEDSNNLQYIAIGVVLNIDDSFINLLNEPPGTEFIRDSTTDTFFQPKSDK